MLFAKRKLVIIKQHSLFKLVKPMSEGILFDLFNLIGILYLDLIIFSVLIFTIVTVIPFNMKEKWEEDYFPAQISEYIVHFKWQLLLFLTLAILGMKVESLILDAYFINTYWESNGFWRLIH